MSGLKEMNGMEGLALRGDGVDAVLRYDLEMTFFFRVI